MRRIVRPAAVGVLALAAVASVGHPASSDAVTRHDGIVIAGHARFEVLSPTLIRLEYAANGRFENRPTLVARDRRPITAYSVSRHGDELVLRTRKLVLRYRGDGPFTRHNVSVRPVAGGGWSASPRWAGSKDPKNLGGWVRALDDDTGPVATHPGVLSRRGWYLLNDTHDVVMTSTKRGYAARPTGSRYQDGYFFGYGENLRGALRDLRRLTGPTPLLPRTAFGVWFSRYYSYSGSDYHGLLASFRRHHVPIDTLSIDTDWKRQPSPLSPVLARAFVGATRAYSWNGWEWNRTLFPHPAATIRWLHRYGIQVALNIHPSIDSSDPRYAATIARTGPLAIDPTCTLEQIDPTGTCHVFDLTKPAQVAAYFALHNPIRNAGVDEWWLDWCCDATTINAPGLTPDTWFNHLYARYLHHDGDRWLVLSRIGGSHQGGDAAAGPGDGIFAEHRDAIHFTGDTCATWAMLRFEARLTAEEGNVGVTYVSHDIGSFNGAPINGQCGATAGASGAKDPPDIYARWVQFGAMQPILRLHSNHGERLPWEYPHGADRAAARALRLREALVPYLYSAARTAYDTGLPMTRSLYLQWPHRRAAYHHPSEYTLGSDLLFSPTTTSGHRGTTTMWIPPGRWVDYFTGETYAGPSTRSLHVPLDQMALLVRAGAVIPTQPSTTHTTTKPPTHLDLTVLPHGDGSYRLYDDAGTGYAYRHGAFTWTRITHTDSRGDSVVIGPAVGRFAGQPRHRSWTVEFRGVHRPRSAQVDGHRARWSYNSASRVVTVKVGPHRTSHAVRVTLR